MAPTKLALASN